MKQERGRQLRDRLRGPAAASDPARRLDPIREDLLGPDRLEERARELARADRVDLAGGRGARLLARLEENGRVLLECYRDIAQAIRDAKPISPAAEWLADNFHIVEDQLREIRDDLPPGYYRELPKLVDGPLAGAPRVYGVAWTYIAHTDSRIDLDTLRRFVAAYQTVRTLTIGELWALAISLRLVLAENLRRLAERVVTHRAERERADAYADSIRGTEEGRAAPEGSLRRVLQGPLPTAFVVQLLLRLRDLDPEKTPALRWIDDWMEREGLSRDDLVYSEQRSQVATNVSVRNVITSMRLLSIADWRTFFEGVSVVARELAQGTNVGAMDFETRNRYRDAVEGLAKGSQMSEEEIARRAVAQSAASGEPPGSPRADPGYYLISRGRPEFEREIGYRPSLKHRVRRACVRWANPGYPMTICLLSLAVVLVPLDASLRMGAGVAAVALLGLLALFPASEIAVAVLNRDVTDLIGPRRLPKLALDDGIPEELATMVVVPTLLVSEDEARQQVEQLEVRYLANPDGYVFFALLTDWTDAPEESRADDARLLEAARAAVTELNARHGPAPDGGPRFFLFHRRRVRNESEGCWMGWERKRGKLEELDRLLRGAPDTTFLPDEKPPCSRVRYVVTLDGDTRLPRGAVRRLVGAMAHPLNRPVFDEAENRVVAGHGILQPRMTPTLPAAGHESLFGRLFSGPRGIDPYAFAVSDVYQDLFGEAIYTGKGIYDVDAFERALAGRVPENTLLSHDLFEGLFARAGFVSDVELFEQFPSHYEVAAARQHRWARGDWQLLRWLPRRVPDAAGRLRRNPLPPMGLWKILDNIRRSLVAPFSVASLIVGWTLPGAIPIVWTAFVLSTIAVPRFLPVLAGAIPHRRRTAKRSVLRGFLSDVVLTAANTGASIILLAHQAWVMTDAIVRTLGRVYGTGRRLLEWTTSAQTRSEYDLSASGFARRNVMVIAIAASGLALSAGLRPSGVAPTAVLFFVLWASSPFVAWDLSRQVVRSPREPLSAAGEAHLRSLARRTWRFFEAFAGPDDHHLPPDNFQEDPHPVLAHRTSPTNIGLSLLATIAAHDFGWIGATETSERLERLVSASSSLERFRGHLLNWYDTRTLAPLEPRYVSTVDSGNLAAHLIVVKQTCLELAERPLAPEIALAGLRDVVRLLRDGSDDARFAQMRAASRKILKEVLDRLEERLVPLRPGETLMARLDALAADADALAATAGTTERRDERSRPDEFEFWCHALQGSIASHRRDLVPAGPAPAAAVAREAAEVRRFARAASGDGPGGLREWVSDDERRLEAASPEPPRAAPAVSPAALAQPAEALVNRLLSVAAAAEALASEMDFSFLFDRDRKLFSIGYRLSDGCLDTGFYDLLASEARLASYLAIARREAPVSHWFHLGRALTPVGKGSALVSWSGSMFEYLMPDLVMAPPADSLLDLTTRLVVGRQIRYGAERGVPWGISESGFYARDVSLAYQYSSFGVGGLGLKRGLSEDLVIAPYATALAAMVDPSAAVKNFRALTRAGALGDYGYYEAVDYTPSRLPEGTNRAVVREYMAHHQGMTLAALANVLCGGTMRRRFHSEPLVQSAELLLQERTPRDVAVSHPRAEEVGSRRHVRDFVVPVLRRFQSPHDPTPRAHLLSNGRYSVMVTAAGSGYSRFEGSAVTRWREDPTRDAWGSYVFIRDVASGKVWSAGHQPSGAEADSYDVAFYEDRVEIRRRDGGIATMLEIVVSPESDAELRQVSITNLGVRPRELEVTSYAELVLGDPRADDAHPAFSNLFVETEFVPGLEALVATRRTRSPSDPVLWAAHVAAVEGAPSRALQFETDRARFVGRGRDLRSAAAVHEGLALSNTVGPVLDPIFSLRRRVTLAPGGNARVTFSTIVARSREKLLEAADRCRDPSIFERTVALAWTQAQVELGQLRVSADEAHLFQRLSTRLVYSDPTLRAPSGVLTRNRRGVTALWPYGISGDRPIVLLRIDQAEDREIFGQLLRAQEYWRMKGLLADLVVLNEEAPSYSSELQPTLETMLRTSGVAHEDPRRAGVYLLQAPQVPPENRDAIAAAARIVLLSRNGPLADQVVRFFKKRPTPKPPSARRASRPPRDVPAPHQPLRFWNGTGGFSEDGSEYVTILERGQATPAPWSNVMANRDFGCIVTESGSGYTWAGNSRENHLTPWSNDSVSDTAGEAIYLRDEESGEVWSATALPMREETPYLARHGQGYSRFEHESHELALELTVFVDPEDPVKVSRLTIENRSGRARTITVTSYAEWVLGATRSEAPRFVVTSFDAETAALHARNPWNGDFPDAVAFAALDAAPTSFTADRTEFLGRNGSAALPSGLAPGLALSGRCGAALDPCAALQRRIPLAPGERAEVRVFLGEARDEAEARRLVTAHREKDADATLRQIRRFWDGVLGGLQIKTPDPALDVFVNRWLLYQALSCRLWGRTAFYQSGGAYGFRDQLQDALAFAVTGRDLLREQILRAAARQFTEGDVQHWWHPPTGRGVRTRISDDALWLPFAVARYLEVTGDETILGETVPFLEGEALPAGEDERYFVPAVSRESGDVFEHCARAIDRALPAGAHGLPLMGTGDWNDGMNRVGSGGKGESVWLAWFLRANLAAFAPIAQRRGEAGGVRAARWRERLAALDDAIEGQAWDGDWYRRAYYDDGSPLGSAGSDECRIDSIAQSWAVIAGGGRVDRARRAMDAVDQQLIRRSDGLTLLFTPPFNGGAKDPGYIGAYPPGIRENGGQYNHAAFWAVVAYAELGDGDRAGELLSLLNPLHHTGTRPGLHRYRVEPYVIAGDVYSEHPHVGRGGWSWYTGSAGWMYRAAVEWVLGVRVTGSVLHFAPCIPRTWRRFEVTFRYHSSRYHVTVENPRGVSRGVAEVRLDGRDHPLEGGGVPLVDDGGIHRVDVLLG